MKIHVQHCISKNLTVIILLLILMPTCSMLYGQNKDTNPAINLEVIVDGKKFEIQDGDTLNIGGSEVIIRSSDYIIFDYGVIYFKYPKSLAFAFEEDYAYKNWTLNGNDLVILYFEIGIKAELDFLIEEMVAQFGKENCEIKNRSTKLGKVKLKGKRIDVKIVGQQLTCDIYEIKSNDAKSHFIVFQDTKNEDGSDSREYTETIDFIKKSIKYTSK